MTTIFAVGTAALAASPNPSNHALSPPPRPPAPSPSPSPFYYLAAKSDTGRAHIVSHLPPSSPLPSSSSHSSSSSCLRRETVSSPSSSPWFGKLTLFSSYSSSSQHSNCQLDDLGSFSSSSSSSSSSSPCSFPCASSSWDSSSSPPSSSAGVVVSSVSSSKKATRLHHHLHSLSRSFLDWTDLCRPFLGGVGGGGGGEAGGGGGGGGVEERRVRRRRRAMRIVVPISRKSEREASGVSPRDSTSSSSSLVSLSPSSSSSAALNAYHSSPRSDVTARFAADDGVSSLGLFVPAEESTMGRNCCSERDDTLEDTATLSSSSPFTRRMSNDGSSAGCAFAYSHPSILAMDGSFVAEAPSGTVICNSRGCRPIGNDACAPFELDRGDEWIRRRDAAVILPRRLAEFHSRAERFDEMRGGGGEGGEGGGGGGGGGRYSGAGNNNVIGSRRQSASGRGGGGAVGVHHSSSAVSPVKHFAGEFAQYCGEFCETDLAEKYYLEAIEASPRNSKLLADYATFAWRKQNDKMKAEQLFNRALEEAPDCAEVLASYALFLWQLES